MLISYTPTGQNDHIGLQQAINQAGPGGRVDVTQGRAVIGRPVVVSIPITFTGQGSGTVFARAPNYSGGLLEFRGGAPILSGVVARDFHVDDQASADLAAAIVHTNALYFFGCKDARLAHVQIHNGFRGGVSITESEGVTLDDVVVEDVKGTKLTNTPDQPASGSSGGHGITIFARPDKPACRNIKIVNCTLRRNWRTGLFLNNAQAVKISDCDFVDNMPKAASLAGIEIGGQIGIWPRCRDLSIVGNTIVGGHGTQGIEIDVTTQNDPTAAPATGITIVGNTIRDQGITGLLLYMDKATPTGSRSTRVVIQGNTLENCTSLPDNTYYGGITVSQGASDFLIAGNVIREERNVALKLEGKNERWVLVGNHLETNGALVAGIEGVFADGNRNLSTGATTGQVGVGTFLCNRAVMS